MEIKQTISLKPIENSIALVTDFVKRTMEQGNVSQSVIYKFCIAVDEMYSNIVHYSGAKFTALECIITTEEAIINLKDDGMAFNPLIQSAPKLPQKAEEREFGGLGIYMTRKLIKQLDYRRENEFNILTMKMNLE